MARSSVIPPKTTLTVAMPATVQRALLLSKASLQEGLYNISNTIDPSKADPDSEFAEALAAVNLVLGLPDDYRVSRLRLVSMAYKA